MDNFTIIYKILKALEEAMDYEIFDTATISPERLGISKPKWEKILIMLKNSGYITGIVTERSLSDYSERIVEPITPVITLKGLEYLSENSMMQKAYRMLKGIKEITPGI